MNSRPDAHKLGEKSRREHEAGFELLVRSVKDYAIFMLDPEGRVASWNEGAERIKGYSADEIMGKPITIFYSNEVVQSGHVQRELESARQYGRFEDEGWRVRKDGSQFWANVVITALRAPDGELLGFAKVTRDLTERRQAEEQARQLAAEQATRDSALLRSQELAELNSKLQEQAAELKEALDATKEARNAAELSAEAAREAYRELDQFAYIASHDLKAPLRGIGNLVEWLQDDLGEKIEGESIEHMRLLQVRVRRMTALIEGILTYSRAGRQHGSQEQVDTGAVLSEIIDLLNPPEQVRVQWPQRMPTIEAELVPLQQVFMNLIGNAIKFTLAVRPDPAIAIEWRDVNDGVEFAITDNGPGIEPQFHDRIWAMFQTLNRRDDVEGTGIGLSVVKKVVERRGGRVSVESLLGEGATFRFVWPKSTQEDVSHRE
ncbi:MULTISPECIES: ATP-binding protein [unclassified Mesorhizobium]|uniref:PAS domain-containing sensor histidine kinase n=1 Tax=unclassified Mesorhizobium TaxID=325217 RepID=UPI00112C4334|nr:MULTISPECIES: ATP-binding protein [unclassified Mesorhizobium]TPL23565.1 PAS domain S-box protein [Mesorhizobium sp. B2-4-9]TPM89485.1 PAS domain S-box protein [Mesorhizobium sp. B2-1-5]